MKTAEETILKTLEELFQIAMVNTSYTLKSFKKELEEL